MKLKIFFIIAVLSVVFVHTAFAKELKIVVTYPFLGDIVKNITKEKAIVTSISNGYEDPHFITPRPSMIMKMRDADAVVLIGMALDVWVQGLIESSRNEKIMPGSFGYIDVSKNINKLEVPSGKVDASMGHVHIQGNPHYHLNPSNIKVVANTIAEMLSKIDEKNADFYKNNANDYTHKLEQNIEKWQDLLAQYKDKKTMTYHASWPYFEQFSGLKIEAQIEPKPGIPPTPSHLEKLVKKIKKDKIALCVCEDYFSHKAPEFLQKKTGIKILFLPIDLHKNTPQTYIELWDKNIKQIVEALEAK